MTQVGSGVRRQLLEERLNAWTLQHQVLKVQGNMRNVFIT